MTNEFYTLGCWDNPDSYKAAIILLTDKLGRVSIQFRDDFEGVALGGLWGLFGGEIEELLTKAITAATPLTDSNGQRLLAIKGEAFNKREGEGENDAANAQLQAAL